jgi:pimeloyl-ACP methyl ester carboxylesterase
VAAICGATAGLARAGLLDERNHASCARDYLAATGYAGGDHYIDERAVVEGDLVTAGPQSPVQFARAQWRGVHAHAGRSTSLTPEIKHAYLAPNPTAASRTGVLIFLREIPTGPSDPASLFWGELEDGLERHFRDKPVAIAWGMKDAAFTPAVLDELWLGTFPHAVVTRVPDAGHFIQEDAHERVVPALLEHLRNSPSRSNAGSADGEP